MTWFRVDDSLAFHAKVVAAGNAAMGLWVRAGAWSAQQLTDGFVPDHMLVALGGTKSLARRLVDAGNEGESGLWLREEHGYRFHDWPKYQPTADEIRSDRATKHEAKVRAGRAGGLASGVARRKHDGSTAEAQTEADGEQNEAPSHPVPTVGRDGDGTSKDPSRNATRARSGEGWHAQVIEARRSAGAEVGPSWSKRRCLNEIRNTALEYEVTEDVAWAALVELAREPETKHPGRLTHQLQRVLEQAVRPPLRLVSGRPAWCGSCQSDGLRVVEVDGDIKPCPTCGRRTA